MPKNIEDFEDPSGVDQIWNDDEVNPNYKEPKKKKTRVKISKKINKKNPFGYLNNLKFDNKTIDTVIKYLQTDELPKGLNERQTKKFIEHYSMNWIVENKDLIFEPLDLIAVCEDDIEEVLTELYKDLVKSLGKGIQSFYDTVKNEVVGITRKDVEAFLKKQEDYQLSFVKQKKVQKPIYANFPNEKWSMDLVDLNQYTSHNQQYRYILTVIDYFSRKVFAEKLKNKDLESVKIALEKIVSEQAGGITPTMLICDNGSEFQLLDWCKVRSIKLLHTESYSPTQNSLIENFNGSLRRLIRANFIKKNNLIWINDLQLFLDNYNSRKHNTTKFIPNQIWKPEKCKVTLVEETDDLKQTNEQKISELSKTTTDRVTKQIARLQQQTLTVGDTVRVATSSLNSEIRKANKAGNSKLVVVKFSAKVFTVDKVTVPRQKAAFALPKYILKDKKGKVLLEEFNLNKPNKVLKPKKFNVTELLKIDKDTVNTRGKQDEEKLNKIENVEYVEPEIVEQPRKSVRLKALTTKEKAAKTRQANKVIVEPIRKSTRSRKEKELFNI